MYLDAVPLQEFEWRYRSWDDNEASGAGVNVDDLCAGGSAEAGTAVGQRG